MKKAILLAVVTISLISLVGCNEQTEVNEPQVNETQVNETQENIEPLIN